MHLIPKSFNAQGACSRLDPHPKFSPVDTKIFDCLNGSLLRTKSGFSSPPGRYLLDQNRADPSPVLLSVLRNCLGMRRSVSTLGMERGAAIPLRMVKEGIPEATTGGVVMDSMGVTLEAAALERGAGAGGATAGSVR